MNELEARLRSWAPRRPSASVERRLFSPRPPAARPAETPAFRSGWLAAGAAATVLAGLFLLNHNARAIGPASAAPYVAMILSNQYAAAYLPGGSRPAENRLPADQYEWSVSAGTSSIITAVLGPRRRD